MDDLGTENDGMDDFGVGNVRLEGYLWLATSKLPLQERSWYGGSWDGKSWDG
jgi:hypothetical protein